MQDLQSILPNGTVVQGRYVIEDLLGRGGFGAVYLVRDQRTRGNLFALKEITDTSKQERERFAFECEVLKRLDHHALPRVYRVFDDGKSARAYMLMDYIEGPNLERLRLQQPEKRFAVEKALDILAPIFAVVGYLHKQDPPIIHRDVKPANIIVPASNDEAVLVDLGIAKEYNIDATTTAVRRCSPGYGAPEQYDTGTNPRTDIYGLAATLYVLLTGVIPTDAFFRMAQIGGRKSDPLEPVAQLVPSIPSSVSAAIQKAMSINSADRFASVEEFWQALGFDQKDRPLAAAPVVMYEPSTGEPLEPVTVVTRPVRTTNRRGAIAVVFTSLLLLALVGGLAVGRNFFASSDTHAQLPKTTPVIAGKKAATSQPTTRPKATPRPTATPTPRPRPTATPVPPTPVPSLTPAPPASSGVPSLAGAYDGTITDQIGGLSRTANLKLSPFRQSNTSINGYATISSSLQGSNSFAGTVSAGGAISFLLAGTNGNLPLYFSGQVAASSGSISGTYCSYSNGACDNAAGGYGVWYVTSTG
ncbi:MAG: serine/threonine protein kinase [Ktedonobacteraceae bacterium]|nr:serine/threonine protein kinase [Ktedonobacteraceae bacterium]